MIKFENVVKKYNNLEALSDISLEIPKGKIFGIVGKSGAGKSTLLRTINQLETIESGNIYVNEVDVTKLRKKDLRLLRKNIGMIFQHFSLLETKNVYENIALPLRCSHLKKDEINKRVIELANIVGIKDKLKSKPRELSGGQKQRVAIARALASNPNILLCDEATSALDPITTKQILNLLKKINNEFGITIILVTHQMEVVKEICESIAILSEGKLIQVGETDEIFLSKNNMLNTLIEEEQILPTSGINIKLFFPKSFTESSFITKMARELNVDFDIAYGKLERFQNHILGSLIINIAKNDENKIIEYIKNHNLEYEVIINE